MSTDVMNLTADKEPMAMPTKSGFGGTTLLVIVVLSMLAGVVGAAGLQHFRPAKVTQFYVVDMGRAVRAIQDDASLNAEQKREKALLVGTEVKRWIDSEVAKGNVVFDKSAVMGAPEGFYVDTVH